ncbi:MAG: hypothetical protein ACR2GX_00665 [Candidatus Dormibacteria bacterium]
MAIEKVSLSLPAELVTEARHWAGGQPLSGYVADGLRQRVLADRQRSYLATLDEQFGPLSDEELRAGEDAWLAEA